MYARVCVCGMKRKLRELYFLPLSKDVFHKKSRNPVARILTHVHKDAYKCRFVRKVNTTLAVYTNEWEFSLHTYVCINITVDHSSN